MEMEQASLENKEKGHSWHHWHHGHHGPLAWLVKLIILMLVFLVGVCVGAASMHHRGEFGRGEGGAKMMGHGPQGMGMPMAGMMGGKTAVNWTRVSGVISSINGSQVTLTDNGGNKQDVYTDANTVIVSGGAQIGVSSLKGGQFVVCFVTMKDGKNMASMIQTQ